MAIKDKVLELLDDTRANIFQANSLLTRWAVPVGLFGKL